MQFAEIVHVMQVAIAPVILISGIGLLLLSMTNRFGRVIDRSRQLAERARHDDKRIAVRDRMQLIVLSRRARIIRWSISLAGVSILLAGCLMIVLFLATLLGSEIGPLLVVLFVLCVGSLIASLCIFLRDLQLSLTALDLEIDLPTPTDANLA